MPSVPCEGGSILGRRAKPDYKIDPETGCWNWLKSVMQNGYPSGRPYRRYYELAHGPVPKGFHVHHKCKNRRCLNPDHLEAIAASDHHVHHFLHENGLTIDDVREIRQLGRNPDTRALDLVERYGVTDMTIYWIWGGRSWAKALGEEGPVRVEQRTCVHCAGLIPQTKLRHARYCSTRCRANAGAKRRRDGISVPGGSRSGRYFDPESIAPLTLHKPEEASP